MNEIKTESYDDFVKEDCVVLFGANWCAPCKQVTPVLEKLSQQYSSINFGKVNIDDEYKLAERFAIRSVPTMMFYSKGSVVKTLLGNQSQNKIVEAIEQLG